MTHMMHGHMMHDTTIAIQALQSMGVSKDPREPRRIQESIQKGSKEEGSKEVSKRVSKKGIQEGSKLTP
jgi:hypothetical protein